MSFILEPQYLHLPILMSSTLSLALSKKEVLALVPAGSRCRSQGLLLKPSKIKTLDLVLIMFLLLWTGHLIVLGKNTVKRIYGRNLSPVLENVVFLAYF